MAADRVSRATVAGDPGSSRGPSPASPSLPVSAAMQQSAQTPQPQPPHQLQQQQQSPPQQLVQVQPQQQQLSQRPTSPMTPQQQRHATAAAAAAAAVAALSELFSADPVWAEVYAACCCDVREAPTLDAARGFRDAVLAQNPDSRPERLSLRGLRLGPATVSCMGLQLKDRQYTSLDLSENQLGDHSALSVRSLVRALPKLRQLQLAGNVITAVGTQEIADELEVNSTLEVLSFGGRGDQNGARGFRPNCVGSDGLKFLLGALSRNPRPALISLNLCQTSLGAEAGRHLAAFLARDRTLLNLDVSCNPLSSQGVCALLPQCARLRLLDIGDTGCKGEFIHSQLAAMMQQTTSLVRLSLARNQFDPKPLRRIARAVAGCQSLTSLSLEGTEMSTEGATMLVEALLASQVQSLTELDLSCNQLAQVEAATALAHMLVRYSTLHTLRLSQNALGDAGVFELAEAFDPTIAPGCELHTLELSRCRVGTAGAGHLMAKLANNERLRVLRLGDNFLDDSLDLELIDHLTHIHELQLTGNRLSYASLQRASQAVARNRQTIRDKEPCALRSEMHRMLFQETKLSAAKEQVHIDLAEVEERQTATNNAIRDLEHLRTTEAEARQQVQKKIQVEDMELGDMRQRREELAAKLAQTTKEYAQRQHDLRETLRQREQELTDLQVKSDDIERRLEARRREHPQELLNLKDRAKAAFEEAAQFQEHAKAMRQQLKALQEKGLIDFKP